MKFLSFKKLLISSGSLTSTTPKRCYIPETKFNPHDKKQQTNKHNHDHLTSTYQQLLLKSTNFTTHLPKATDAKKKLPTRQRIEYLLDEGSFFLELSQLAGHGLYPGDDILCGGLISGVGLINKKLCMIIANDYSQKGGSYFPITIKKQLRAQEIADKLNLPCLYLVDSAGANLPRQSDVFPDRDHFGRIFYNISRMSAKGVPQVAIVLGSCTAGGAYVPAMCDESVIVQNQGTVFLAGPPLVKAATGEVVSAEELGGGETHTKISGVCDYLAKDEFDALKKGREIVSRFNPKFDFKYSGQLSSSNHKQRERLKELEYLFDPTLKDHIDSKHLIDRIVDSGFSEFKPEYGKSLITGFGDVMGQEVGFVSNNGVLFPESALKAAHFIQLCNQRNVPLLFLQNITGFMVGKKYEWEGIAKHGAKMVNAVANARVPKITLLFGASYGAGNYGMCGRAYSPEFLFSWPMSRISVMGGQQAANVMLSIKKDLNEQERQEYFEKMKNKYEMESEAIYATARLWDDGIVMPEFTRDTLGLGFLICKNNWPDLQIGELGNFGVFRM